MVAKEAAVPDNLISSPLGGSTKAVIDGSTEQKMRRVEIMWAVGTILNDLYITISNDEKAIARRRVEHTNPEQRPDLKSGVLPLRHRGC